MRVLVAYASRHGATRGIAERIAEKLSEQGLDVRLQAASEATNTDEYDAFVIGSAAYMFHWLKEASEFVRRNKRVLVARPTWLFSSGPIGPDRFDPKTGKDQLETTIPREFEDFELELHPRGKKVFFGAWDPDYPPVGWAERVMHMTPARKAMPAGDFRDWPEIEAWAMEIAAGLEQKVTVPA